MKIAVIYDGFPWPHRSGDNTRIDQLIQVLRSYGHEVWLVCTALPLPQFRSSARGKVDHLCFYYPKTLRNRLRIIKRWLDYWLARWGLPTAEDMLMRLLGRRAQFVEITDYWRRCPAGLDDFVAMLAEKEGIEQVIVEYVWLYRATDRLPDAVRTAIDVHDIQYRRVEEFRKIGKVFPLSIDREQEFRIYDQFDAAIAIQHSEAAELKSALHTAAVVTAGVAFYDPLPMPIGSEPSVLFLGGYNEANRQGLLRFLKEVWPVVARDRPGARLKIGGYVCRVLEGRQLDPRVQLLGFVEDARSVYAACDIVINPLWVGTGLKIKTVEALGHARPLLTTSVGIEGMLPNPGGACVVRDEPGAMAEALVNLIGSRDDRLELAANARRYAATHLSAENVYSELVTWIASVGGT